MLEYDWDASVGYWICSTSHAIRKRLGAQLAQEKITLRQFEVLASLSKTDGCGSQSELADMLGIEPHTLAGVLKRMERDGLLERTVCEQDRRKNKIRPTSKAEEMWNRATMISHAIRTEILEGFSPEELENLRELCERLRTNLASNGKVIANATLPTPHPSPQSASLPISPATRS